MAVNRNQSPNRMIKNWRTFLESQLNLFEPYVPGRKKVYLGMYSMNAETILDLLYEFEDNKYLISVEFGSAKTINTKKGKGDYFTDEIKSYEIRPTILITIIPSHRVTYENLDRAFKTFIKRIQTHFKSITFHAYLRCDRPANYSGMNLDLKNLSFEGGIFDKEDPDQESLEHLFILCVDDVMTITDKEIFDYYEIKKSNFTGISFENGKAIIELMKSDLVSILIDDPEQEQILVDGPEDSSLTYFPDRVDHYELFEYYLTSENIERILRISIKDKSIEDIYHDVEFFRNYNTVDELIDDIKKEKSISKKNISIWNSIGKWLSRTTDFYNEIKDLYSDMERTDYMEQYTDNLESTFKKCVERELGTKIRNISDRKIEYEADGKKRESVETFYSIEFNIDWIKDLERENIEKNTIDSIISDYHPDYLRLDTPDIETGHVDWEKFNAEVGKILNQYSGKP